jgi:hypothetical protein
MRDDERKRPFDEDPDDEFETIAGLLMTLRLLERG